MQTEVGSSGEIMWKKLSEVVRDLRKLLLLDEWDANLDTERLDKMNAEISQLSQSILIIEVRHR